SEIAPARGSSVVSASAHAKGKIRFTPGEGAAEKRTVVAIVERNGLPRGEYKVATFRALAVQKPQQPFGVHVIRSTKKLDVAWQRARPSDSYQVTVALSDGRKYVRITDHPTLSLKGVSRGLGADVTVRAISASGVMGAPAVLKAGHK